MSEPTKSQGTPNSKYKSPQGAARTWIDRILPLLPGVQPTGVTTVGASAKAAPASRPYLVGNHDAARKAYEKIEANKRVDDQWSFEDALKERNKNIPPVFQFPSRNPVILGPDEQLGVGDKDYEKLPKDLKPKMTPEVWTKIKGQRATLISIYLRLREYNAWDAVSAVTGIKEKLPGHGKVGAIEFSIYGTGGIAFEEHNMGGLAAILVGTGHFGLDNKLMSILHPGQKSYREWRAEEIVRPGVLDESIHEWGRKTPPPNSSLHVSMGPGKAFDAHIDRISPVVKPVDGQSVPGPNAVEHIGEEAIRPDSLIPLISRIPIVGKIPKPPGVGVNISRDNISPVPREPRKVTTVMFNFKVEWDLASGANTKKRKRVYNPHPPQLPAPKPEVTAKIERDAKPISKRFPRTSENDINAEVLADIIARKVLDAAGKGGRSISVDFPNYIHTTLSEAEQKAVHDAVMEIGRIVRDALGADAGSVNTVTVQIPANGASDVRIKK
ncbi:MAG TPA: hypothetical protein VJ828_03790 [Lacipirellulaceae bacterium]|nr:hypothetical protein [Lacipirellulaceae bacterium]